MGLDMYLEKCDRKAWKYRNLYIDEIKNTDPNLYEEIKPFLSLRGKYIEWESIFSEIGYWRKANAIHKWFVDNVQNGVDDCKYYEVTKEQLEELLDICNMIITKTQVEKGLIRNGETCIDGNWYPILEEGEFITNFEVAKDLLPTQEGFFFGSTDYDEYYVSDIKDTIEILTKALEETDFDKQMIVYRSSW